MKSRQNIDGERASASSGEAEEGRRRRSLVLLVVRCQLGEPAALDELVVTWHPAVFRYLRSFVDDEREAGDVAQEVWLGVLRGLPRLKQRESFAPWLFGIARRTALDVLRRRYHRRTELEWDPEQEPVPSSELDESPLTSSNRFDPEELQAGLAALSPLEREVVVLYYLQDLSLEEVAAATSTPSGTIKSRLHRARRKLRAALEDPSHE